MFYNTLGYYLVQYDYDGVYEVKEDNDIEFIEIPEDRECVTDFRVEDAVRVCWKDGEMYDAVILDCSGKTLQMIAV